MEKLKSTIPKTLERRIAESTRDDLSSTCSSLLDFFLQQSIFHKVVGDLSDPEMGLCGKNAVAAMEAKRKGNDFVSQGNYSYALSSYSQALRVAPAGTNDVDKNLLAMLYVNRAFVLHKMDFLMECLRDCDRALAVSPGYTKGWYRRGKVYASLEKYEDAVHDLHVAMNMEPSSSRKKQIENELQAIQAKQNESSSSQDSPIENKISCLQSSVTDKPEIELQILSTPNEGRCMACLTDIPSGFLIHTEEPYAAIISKMYRETYCHYCFSELPKDTVPCPSCSIPVYCSNPCQEQAGGKNTRNNTKTLDVCETSSLDLENYIKNINLSGGSCNAQLFAEHRHECHGAHWSAVLPSEVVLAGRIVVKFLEQKNHSSNTSNFFGVLNLSHHYEALSPERKLERHIYSIILMYCLEPFCGSKWPKTGDAVSKLVVLLSQIDVNSMAVVRMKSRDVFGSVNQSQKYFDSGDYLTSNMEQVRVAQAIYLSGSLFNHSCKPNVHAYFASRNLCVRATESVAAGCRLELSYGPQVGQQTWRSRQKFLKDNYSFECHCRGCSELNLSDLVLNAFRCVKPECIGVVLESCEAENMKQKIDHLIDVSPDCSSESHLAVDKQKSIDIVDVASCLFEQTRFGNQIKPGYCLKCGFYRDMETSLAKVKEAGISLERLQDAIVAAGIESTCLSNALKCLVLLRSALHSYNKKIAEVEDNLAQGFCLLGELQPAVDHCEASIEILEKLYGPSHIAIANELVKLASLQLSLGDPSALESLNRASSIFLQYYGSDTQLIYPHFQDLVKEAHNLVH